MLLVYHVINSRRKVFSHHRKKRTVRRHPLNCSKSLWHYQRSQNPVSSSGLKDKQAKNITEMLDRIYCIQNIEHKCLDSPKIIIIIRQYKMIVTFFHKISWSHNKTQMRRIGKMENENGWRFKRPKSGVNNQTAKQIRSRDYHVNVMEPSALKTAQNWRM